MFPQTFTLPHWLVLGLTLLIISPTGADSSRIELIELKGRTAEEIIPLLQPVVAPDGALSGTGYRLIVRATAAQMREIRRLLDQLDQAPQRLRITVQMGELSQQDLQESDLQIDKRNNHGGIETGQAGTDNERGVRVHQQDRYGSAAIRFNSTRSVSDAANRQQIKALEGEPAYIATGSERPYASQVESWRGPRGGSGRSADIDYKQAVTGFYALARLRGDQVVVQISPQKEAFDRHSGGTVTSQRITTTVSGPLGGWLQLGGTGSRERHHDNDVGRTTSTLQTKSQPMWIKVDINP